MTRTTNVLCPLCSREMEAAPDAHNLICMWSDCNLQDCTPLGEGTVDAISATIDAARARIAALEAALRDLFQSCSGLPLPEMDRMETVINAASIALAPPPQDGPR